MNAPELMISIREKQAKLQILMSNVYELNSFRTFKENPSDKMKEFIQFIEDDTLSEIVQISVFVDEAKSYNDRPNEAGIVSVTVANGTVLNITSFSSDFYLEDSSMDFVEISNDIDFIEESDIYGDEDEYTDMLQATVESLQEDQLVMDVFWSLEGVCGSVEIAPSMVVLINDIDNSLKELEAKIQTQKKSLL
jgi:hypothetical protein